MSIADIVAYGWRAFWANVLSPTSIALFLAVLLGFVLVGFAFHQSFRAADLALRACAFLLGVVLLTGFAGILGINLGTWQGLFDWIARLVQFPLYDQVA